MLNKFCTQCGTSINPDSKFCTTCGAKVEQQANSPAPPAPPKAPSVATPAVPHMDSPVVPPVAPSVAPPLTPPRAPSVSPQAAVSAVGSLIGNTALAAAAAGEMTFTQAMPALGGKLPGVELGPLKYLLGGVGRLFKGIAGVFRDKKRIVPALVVSLLWLILLLLPALGVEAKAMGWLSFLTFAQGGTGGGTVGMVGGIIGKGFFAYFVSALLFPFFTGGKPFAGIGGGLKSLFRSLAVKEKSAMASLLFGAGSALIGYNFLTGNASLQNSMAGIVAFLISLRALGNKGGFLRGFIMSLLNKPGKGQMPDMSNITRIMAGWAAGFALGVALSVTGISIIGYLVGIVVVIAAVVLKIFSGSKKEAVAG